MQSGLKKKIKKGRIICFEPVKDTFLHLQAHTHLNNIENMEIYNCGLSDKDRVTEIFINDYDSGENSLDVETSKKEQVTLRRFDTIDLHLNNIDLIKIDVELHELSVLKGMENTLKKYKPDLLVEISDLKALDFVKKLGYKVTFNSGVDYYLTMGVNQ